MKKFKWMMMVSLLLVAALYADKPVLKIAYSDWPGWTAWEIADKKGFFKKHGVNVKLEWFEYGPSMDAFCTAFKERVQAEESATFGIIAV